ncbi:hypothetical protein [Cytobacillus gottheilii]|uniref:hypothetical protein n=1 Tax=Cytobacillus gottheilii TaxID=859144 RepID=UPI001C587C2F|nr:hypothetical protein [Cytobacillus gottheilii]
MKIRKVFSNEPFRNGTAVCVYGMLQERKKIIDYIKVGEVQRLHGRILSAQK